MPFSLRPIWDDTKSSKQSDHRITGLPLFLHPSGLQFSTSLVHRPSLRLATCPAHFHFLLLCSSTQSLTPSVLHAASTWCVTLWIHSAQPRASPRADLLCLHSFLMCLQTLPRVPSLSDRYPALFLTFSFACPSECSLYPDPWSRCHYRKESLA